MHRTKNAKRPKRPFKQKLTMPINSSCIPRLSKWLCSVATQRKERVVAVRALAVEAALRRRLKRRMRRKRAMMLQKRSTKTIKINPVLPMLMLIRSSPSARKAVMSKRRSLLQTTRKIERWK